MSETGIRIVDEQLAAYNSRDLERFVNCYAENVVVVAFPSGEEIPEISGSMFRERYHKVFVNSPNLHCTVVSRCIKGNIVIDQEIVTGFNQGEPVAAVAFYEVEDEKIKKVWFVR